MVEDPALALGAGAQRGVGRKVHRLAIAFGLLGVVAEVELQLPVGDVRVMHQLHLGREGPAGLGAEAFERADLPVCLEGFGLGYLERPTGRDLGEGETAAFPLPVSSPASLAPVVLIDPAAALGTGGAESGCLPYSPLSR